MVTVPATDMATSAGQKVTASAVHTQPLQQAERTVTQKNTPRESEILSGLPSAAGNRKEEHRKYRK
jgi:hypothetical protein